jgi:hypothetical protein
MTDTIELQDSVVLDIPDIKEGDIFLGDLPEVNNGELIVQLPEDIGAEDQPIQ